MKLATFSFDDGCPEDFVVLDLFRKYNIVPTFYITSCMLNLDALTYGMTTDEIRRGYSGSEIGSHTVSHPHLSLQDQASTRFELETSKRVIREKLGVDPILFSHPYGSTGPHTDAELKCAGYQWARRIWRSHNMEKRDRLHMPIDCMFTSPGEETDFEVMCESGENIHVLGHSWWIVRQGLLPQLEQWTKRLLAAGYTILPNSAYFQRTFKP